MRVAPEIVLTSEERSQLSQLLQSENAGTKLAHRARIVLLAAGGMQNKGIAAELKVGRVQVSRWRERYRQLGVGGIVHDLPRGAPSRPVDAQAVRDMTTQSSPGEAAKWSTRSMAAKLGISAVSVSRHGRANGLAPHGNHAGYHFEFLVPNVISSALDDIVGLYLSPSVRMLVLSGREAVDPGACDDATQANSKPKKNHAAIVARANLRLCATTLENALEKLRPKVGDEGQEAYLDIGRLKFLRRVERATAPEKLLHILTDDRASYQNPQLQTWLTKHTRFNLHFGAADSTWTNKVQEIFAAISDKVSLDGFVSAPQLVAAVQEHVGQADACVHPFMWTTTTNKVRDAAGHIRSVKDEAPRAGQIRPGIKGGPKARMSENGHSLREHVTALKRDRILQEAATLFFERGYLQTSVDAIAERMGATKPFVYYHFQSKVDILVEICERSNRDALAAVESAMFAKGSPLVRLEQFLREFTNIALQQHQLVAIYFREAISLPGEAAERINQMRKSINLRLSSLLREGINSGDFQIEDPRIGALVIAGMSSYAFAWYRERGRLEQLEVTDRIVKMALKLVSAAPYRRPTYPVHPVAPVS